MAGEIKFDFSKYDIGGNNAVAKDGKLTGDERIKAEQDGWNVWERYRESDTTNYYRDGQPGRHDINYTGTIKDGWDRLTYKNGVLVQRYSNNNDGLKYRNKLGVLCSPSVGYAHEYGINVSYSYDNHGQVKTEEHNFGYDSYMINPKNGNVLKHRGADKEVDPTRSNFTETYYPNKKLKQYKDTYKTVDIVPYTNDNYKITVTISGDSVTFLLKNGKLEYQEKNFWFGRSVEIFENNAKEVIPKLNGSTCL